jgi:ABC-type tungstate transport system permease subunit
MPLSFIFRAFPTHRTEHSFFCDVQMARQVKKSKRPIYTVAGGEIIFVNDMDRSGTCHRPTISWKKCKMHVRYPNPQYLLAGIFQESIELAAQIGRNIA